MSMPRGLFHEREDRVRLHTDPSVLRDLDEQTVERVRSIVAAGPQAIRQRLDELDGEWDIERLLELNAASLMLVGTALGARRGSRWLLLPGAVAAFLVQHAIQGWCPPMAVFRRLGIRTRHEIELERTALKALRGDFADLAEGRPDLAGTALQVVESDEPTRDLIPR